MFKIYVWPMVLLRKCGILVVSWSRNAIEMNRMFIQVGGNVI